MISHLGFDEAGGCCDKKAFTRIAVGWLKQSRKSFFFSNTSNLSQSAKVCRDFSSSTLTTKTNTNRDMVLSRGREREIEKRRASNVAEEAVSRRDDHDEE